jgi:predicted SnoaL-like aldol condensation-catalyzing enzyme
MRMQWGVLLIVILLMFSCAQEDKSTARNKATSDRFTNEVWNSGNLDVLDEVITKDFVRHHPPSSDTPVINGREEMREYVALVLRTYPDVHVEIGQRLAEGDWLAASWTVTGTHAELGVTIEVPGISIVRYQDGKAAEEWVSSDTKLMADQLAVDSDIDADN